MNRHVIPKLYSSNTIGVNSADVTSSYFRCIFVSGTVNAIEVRGLSLYVLKEKCALCWWKWSRPYRCNSAPRRTGGWKAEREADPERARKMASSNMKRCVHSWIMIILDWKILQNYNIHTVTYSVLKYPGKDRFYYNIYKCSCPRALTVASWHWLEFMKGCGHTEYMQHTCNM